MKENHKLTLFIAYYLARFNREAYSHLGYQTMLEAHQDIGEIMKMNPHTVKQMRDGFDPMFGHRAGYYQVPLSKSRIQVAQAMQDLDENAVYNIVKSILEGASSDNKEEQEQISGIITSENKKTQNQSYLLRTATGKKAELFFINYYAEHKLPVDGILVDCREFGVGYDFRIERNNEHFFVEVKGISETEGGILFTNKEWEIARANGGKYFLCIVKGIDTVAEPIFVQDPFSRFSAKRNVYTSIQISWSVSEKQLAERILS